MADFRTPSPDSPAHSQLLQQQQQEANPTPVPPPPTSAALDSSPPSSGISDRKRRGRPRGSKNKPKPPLYITPELPVEPAVKLMHLCVPVGNDVVDMLENFARSKRVGLQVLNGSGSVSGPSGVFNLVNLGGAFVDSPVTTPWLTIFVGGNAAGGVLSGTVVSKVMAVTDVVVNVILFRGGGDQFCYRLEPEMLARMDQSGFKNVPSCGGVGGGAMPMSAAWFGLPAQNLNWKMPAVAGQPPNHHFMSFKN